ncbi:vitamin B12 ABC transporter ATP-binding protein BtuD [Vibrio azureus]|uniref:Vitamin B12 import ATP-binding protein BtuD n=1 Tax=Vibrio azureus NBRC 104587 TaxID=1219077 RepID=U3ALT4_9VIBR|nr:vitamin B12 ABC transporter ATP-binding protein BtuD [Vibrio azureus]AUI85950.1 vitamin B12 ABC transporter ATP-binding protein BtuD [Vibrio azureus]GAD74257.1 putative ABC transporter ATP-binding protein [Vibrio azureus NBRC 104587]
MININDISVDRRLSPTSFTCKAGELIHVIGPNGSGKSTLLSAIAGVLGQSTKVTGSVLINEVDVLSLALDEQACQRGFLSQQSKPAFNIDVFQYLALSLPNGLDLTDSNIIEAVDTVLNLVQLRDKLHQSIQALSGGEWQRVRLAGVCLQVWRTINPDSKLLLLDEPAASLDIAQDHSLYRLIDTVVKQGITVIVANHDLNRTLNHADKVALLSNGVLQIYAETEQVMTPEWLSSAFNTEVRKVQLDDRQLLLFD